MDGEVDETDDVGREKGTGSSMEDENSNEGCTVTPKCRPRLITFSIVNSLGNSEVDSIHDDGRPIKLSSEWSLCHVHKLRWPSSIRLCV